MAARTMTYTIFHDQKLCKMCGICVAFCPGKCLAQDETGKVIIIDEEKCIGCRLCTLRCPDMAIEVAEKAKT